MGTTTVTSSCEVGGEGTEGREERGWGGGHWESSGDRVLEQAARDPLQGGQGRRGPPTGAAGRSCLGPWGRPWLQGCGGSQTLGLCS